MLQTYYRVKIVVYQNYYRDFLHQLQKQEKV